MATLAATHPTLLDVKNRLDASGNVVQVIEMLSQTNEILDDAVWLEANELTGHTTSVRTGIPEPTWRKLYGGVQPSKTTSVKVREGLGMLENYAEVDKSLADLNGNSAAWRMSEESGIIEGFGQKLARYMIYGNEATEPEGFTGLAPRFTHGTFTPEWYSIADPKLFTLALAAVGGMHAAAVAVRVDRKAAALAAVAARPGRPCTPTAGRCARPSCRPWRAPCA